jgi:ABC-type polysaccharide/polyol phosphate transport system ATPase subunit
VSATPAVVVDNVAKRFRLFHEHNQYLKATVVKGRRARYEDFWALDGVSFEVPTGETFGIIGANGSGKSTLLKCVAKILLPERGTVAVNGKMSALLELGAGFHPELTGRENVYLNGSILGLSKRAIDAVFDDIVGFAGLERFIDMPVKNYSSGMYVRLGFAVAVNVDPEVLVIDEVLSVGDEEFQTRSMDKINSFRADGRTIVVVSHGLGMLRTLCDRIVWLESGKVKELGPAEDVVDAYAGLVRSKRVLVEADEARHGSGEVRVERIELLDEHGAAVTGRIHTGDHLTVRLHYSCVVPVVRPVFSVSINRADGVWVTGPTTKEHAAVPDEIEGEGVVDLTFDDLALLRGSYTLSPSVWDYSLHHQYDNRVNAVRFDVVEGHPAELNGLVTLHPRWRFGTP